MSIYFLTFHAQPKFLSEDIAGAYINCWIEAQSILQASSTAYQKIEDENWEVIETEDAFEIVEGHYPENSDGDKYYKQAFTDKWVLVFHTYPND